MYQNGPRSKPLPWPNKSSLLSFSQDMKSLPPLLIQNSLIISDPVRPGPLTSLLLGKPPSPINVQSDMPQLVIKVGPTTFSLPSDNPGLLLHMLLLVLKPFSQVFRLPLLGLPHGHGINYGAELNTYQWEQET